MRLSNIVLFLLSPMCIKAQLSISNLSLTDSTQNILYIGVDNIIKISGKQYDPVKHHTMIIGGGGTLHKNAKGVYIVKVQNETDHCQIWLSENNKSVFKQNYVVRKIGEGIVRYGGLKDSTASVNQLLANPFIFVDIPGSYYKHNINITSFAATFIGGDFDSLVTVSTGSRLTTEQIETVKKLRSGNRIYFNNIYAFGPDSRRRKLSPFTIIIK